MLDWIKSYFLVEGLYVEVRIDNVMNSARYIAPWKNGYHDVALLTGV
jgi:hypothetical protein